MPYPSAKKFGEMVLSQPPEQLVRDFIFPGVPFVFRESESKYQQLKDALAEGIGVDPANITLVGSGRLGFSVVPKKYPQAFGEESDLDVVVVSDSLFDKLWYELLVWHVGPTWDMPRHARSSIIWNSKQVVYWGSIRPDLLTRFSERSRTFQRVFSGLGRVPDFATWDVKARVYRTWEHATQYHADCLCKLARQLRASQGT